MAILEEKSGSDGNGKVWNLFRMPFRQTGNGSSSSSQRLHTTHGQTQHQTVEGSNPQHSTSVSSVARAILPIRRRLRLDPSSKLYFPCVLSFFLWIFHVFVIFKISCCWVFCFCLFWMNLLSTFHLFLVDFFFDMGFS